MSEIDNERKGKAKGKYPEEFQKDLDIVAQNVKRIRLEKGMRVSEVSAKSGVSQSTIYSIERGETDMFFNKLCAIDYSRAKATVLPRWFTPPLSLMFTGCVG